MKHIEHYPEILNPSPSQQPTFFSSALAVLKSSFGKLWPISLLTLFIAVFLPVVIFINEIKLDPPLFVTEWLKLIIEGIIFFFILEIVRHRSMSFTARQLLRNFVMMSYVGPTQGVVEALKHFREALEKRTSTDSIQSITVAWHKWHIVEQALSNDTISHLSTEGEIVVWLLKNRDELEPQKCNSILKSLSAVQDYESLNQDEFAELLNRLERFLKAINPVYSKAGSLGGSL